MTPDQYLCELRSAPSGTGFIVGARLRVLSWQQVGKDRLPVTMFGTASRASFIPTRAGVSMVEQRDAAGHRVFVNPLAPSTPLREKGMRHLLQRALAGAFDPPPYTAADWQEFQRKYPKDRHASDA